MKLLLVVLNKTELLEEVIEYFLEADIRGATVLDSVGMGKILSYDIPIFAGFRELMVGSRATNKTVFTTIADDRVKDVMSGLDRIIRFDEPGSGVAMLVDIAQTYGIPLQ